MNPANRSSQYSKNSQNKDQLVSPVFGNHCCGGPPLHRHDFEESFTVFEGEIEGHFSRREVSRAGRRDPEHSGQRAAQFHQYFEADSPVAVHLRSSREEFFAQVGVSVPTRTTPPPKLDEIAQAESMKKARELAPKYRPELLKP
jgi:hypothetical protein